MRADIEGEAEEGARVAAPIVAGAEVGGEMSVERGGGLPVGRDRCGVEAVGETRGAVGGGRELVMVGAGTEVLPEIGVSGGEMAEQLVDVPQVSEAAGEVSVGDEVGGGVADHVGGGEG